MASRGNVDTATELTNPSDLDNGSMCDTEDTARWVWFVDVVLQYL